MDNKLTMLKYVEYCTDKREEAYKECAKYNGFTSQVSETMRENNLDYMQMAAMAEFTKESAEFWNKKCDEAIEEFEKLFNSREEAREYCRTHFYVIERVFYWNRIEKYKADSRKCYLLF